MINIKYKYSGKTFNINPYKTYQEREILLLELLGCEDIIDSALVILGVDNNVINSLSDKEKTALLYKYRSVSIGDEIPITYKCKHCKTPNETTIDINDLVQDSNITNTKMIDKFKDITDENVSDFFSVETDELDLDEFEELVKELKSSVTKFNFIRKSPCIKCKKHNNIDIEKDVIKYMSEDTITSLYQTYNDLLFFSNYNKLDVDSLYPFERTIFVGLLNKTKEEINS
jgi:hypothetical protein